MSESIEVCRGNIREKVVELGFGDVTIGRDNRNTICLPEGAVSRKHGTIISKKGSYYFQDDSTNGTFVNGNKVQHGKQKINHGDTIIIGDYLLYYNACDVPLDTNSTGTTDKKDILKDIQTRYKLLYTEKESGDRVNKPINGYNYTVGDDKKNHIVIKGEGIGEFHFSLRVIDEKVFLQNYNHDTFVNGLKIGVTPVFLCHGDKIKIGDVCIKFVDEDITKRKEAYKYHIVTRSSGMKKIIEQIELTTKFSDKSVLITGTGKELVANAIHTVSKRSKGPYISVNCAAIKKELAESVLFGWKRGSFTGAINDHVGYFEQADGGTLFLDEIGELAEDMQALLLRAIEYKDISPIGSKSSKKIDVRIIAATNRNLDDDEERVKINFRDDFYYRICGIKINVPPLRHRPEDIPLLMDHFLRMTKVDNRELTDLKYSKKAYENAKSYTWNGNVRDLFNACDRAFFQAQGDLVTLIKPLGAEKKIKNLLPHEIMPQHLMEVYKLYKCENVKAIDIAKRLDLTKQAVHHRIRQLKKYQCSV